MKAFVLTKVSDLTLEPKPLEWVELPKPVPNQNEILIKVSCCGVCHTELDEIEGRTAPAVYPVIPGHQVIGRVEQLGSECKRFQPGDRVGVAWIFSSCGECEFCLKGMENLCPKFRATGRDAHGGYSEYMTVDERFAYKIPPLFSDAESAPLLCAGAIGYRSLRLTHLKQGETLGLSGFGASGHLVLKMALYMFPDSKILVFARSPEEQEFALSLGATWAGSMDDTPPFRAHAIIDTTPAWGPVVASMRWLVSGGRLVINAIRKESTDQSALLKINYPEHLWMEKEIKSVANITPADVTDFLSLAAKVPIRPVIEIYPFVEANRALYDLKMKHIKGAKVLVMNPS